MPAVVHHILSTSHPKFSTCRISQVQSILRCNRCRRPSSVVHDLLFIAARALGFIGRTQWLSFQHVLKCALLGCYGSERCKAAECSGRRRLLRYYMYLLFIHLWKMCMRSWRSKLNCQQWVDGQVYKAPQLSIFLLGLEQLHLDIR